MLHRIKFNNVKCLLLYIDHEQWHKKMSVLVNYNHNKAGDQMTVRKHENQVPTKG